MHMILELMLLCSLSSIVYGGLKSCCPLTLSIKCREGCMELVPPSMYNDKQYFSFRYKNDGLTKIVEKCPRSEENFWECLHDSELWQDFRKTKSRNKKLRAKHSGCCKQAKHISCEVECHTTTNISHLLQNENCNAIREPKLTQCIKKVHDAKKCCHSKNKACKHACMQYFKNNRPEHVMKKKKQLEARCGKRSRQFKCAIDQSQFDTIFQAFATCCHKDGNKQCVESCKEFLKNSTDFTNFYHKLTKPCGPFDFNKPIYKCLIQKSAKSVKSEVTIESSGRTIGVTTVYFPFKKQCCDRAKSNDCRDWCKGTISRPNLMGLWDNMYLSCIQNPKEVELSNCMSDVLEPCEIGVKEPMSFCTNFNDRPLELFRRGDQYGDSAARKLHKFWNDSRIEILEYVLSFKNVYQCKPEMFKAMACLLAVKPCDHRSSQRQVCRSDCEELLESCLDKEASDENYSVKRICAAILPNSNQTNCISVKNYTEKNPNHDLMRREDVTLPCEKNPCGEGEMCMINQNCNPNSVVPCKRYKCVKGCAAVGKSKLIIPQQQLAKLSKAGNNGKECYQVCRCQPRSMSSQIVYFGECKDFGCNKRKNCTRLHATYEHGEIFEKDCNTCTCVDGSLDCTEKYCGQKGRPKRHHASLTESGSPCKCHNAYKPVCATNGMTYPNFCLAKCKNIKDDHLSVGDCLSVDPCNPNPCDHGLQCIPTRNVCLSPWRHCPRYTCVSSTISSPTYFSDSFRLCSPDQNDVTEVCGYDGITYTSNCLAEYSGTGVDYEGTCLPSKYRNSVTGNVDRCQVIKCPPVDSTICNVIPPGACCPICGTYIRLSYSKKRPKRYEDFIDYKPTPVRISIKHMRQLLQVAECKLYGHLTDDNDILVILAVEKQKATRALVSACTTEAGRLRECYGNRSPVDSEVCGYDGVTYRCKCQADDAGTGVDYEGPCMPSKYKTVEGNIDRCEVVKCPQIDGSICNLVILPGSCCPVCGSVIRSLYSKEDLRRHQDFIDYGRPITVRDIIKYMRQLLKVAECKLYGHLTVENELLIIVTVDSLKPTRGQVHACKIEAERFHKYINNRSPIVTTSYFLSLLKASKLQTASYKSVRSSAHVTFERTKNYTLISLFTLLTILYLNLNR